MVLEGRLRNINSRRGLIYASAQHHHALVSNNTLVRKHNLDSNMMQKENATQLRRFPKDYIAVDVDK